MGMLYVVMIVVAIAFSCCTTGFPTVRSGMNGVVRAYLQHPGYISGDMCVYACVCAYMLVRAQANVRACGDWSVFAYAYVYVWVEGTPWAQWYHVRLSRQARVWYEVILKFGPRCNEPFCYVEQLFTVCRLPCSRVVQVVQSEIELRSYYLRECEPLGSKWGNIWRSACSKRGDGVESKINYFGICEAHPSPRHAGSAQSNGNVLFIPKCRSPLKQDRWRRSRMAQHRMARGHAQPELLPT